MRTGKPFHGFGSRWEKEGCVPGRKYSVDDVAHVLYGLAYFDAQNLYLGFRCFDRDIGKLKADIFTRDDAVFSDDCVEFFLIPPDSGVLSGFPESSRYFHFAVNSRGVQYDEVGMNSPFNWDASWQCEASVQADRWEVEVALPFSELQTHMNDGTVWAVNFNRAQRAKQELSGWSITFAGFHDPAHFGRMIFLNDWPQPGVKALGPEIEARTIRTFELEPLLSATAKRLRETAAVFHSLQEKSSLPQVLAGRRAVEQAQAEAGRKMEELRALPTGQLVADWERLRSEYERFDRDCEALSARGTGLAGLTEAQLAGREPVQDFLAFVVPAITNDRLLPDRLPAGVKSGQAISLTACPGEYESASFALYALADLPEVRVTASDLQGPGGRISAAALDLRVVKVWYQAGRNVGFQNEYWLTPELLLKDDSLVQVDFEKKTNLLKMDRDAMRDADTLQPVAIPKDTTKQFWLTVQVPPEAAAGDYEGSLDIAMKEGAGLSIPVRLRVLPFTLHEPKQICSIYYRGVLGTDHPTCTSERKTEEQMLAEFRDMVAHGVTNPTVYQGPDGQNPDGSFDFTSLQRVFDLRREAGMKGGPLLILGVGVGAPPELLRATIELAKKNGFSEVYFYGIDEASGDALRAERADFEKVHQAGGKVFVAGYTDSFEIVGDLLDLPVFAGQPDVAVGQAYHSVGAKILSYANPQGGVEEAETYRRNYGLGLWKAGYDGACTYAYQHSFGHAWDDYDDPTYRDHNMAYPTVNGVIPTVQWEGYREGYDDLRYLATLEHWIERGQRQGGAAAERARKAKLWLLRMQPDRADLNELRQEMIANILALQQFLEEG